AITSRMTQRVLGGQAGTLGEPDKHHSAAGASGRDSPRQHVVKRRERIIQVGLVLLERSHESARVPATSGRRGSKPGDRQRGHPGHDVEHPRWALATTVDEDDDRVARTERYP